ncbi:sodium-dependent nutrient amino acid transporter 1-like isoform X2 [Eurytemora carolleeae]|uniref:sodium-dependent nutrient amino acid transporter 1-like isoform X2 n=1 Tax=Eurytemora carolleeae TaxID=1294199 RepID=UPI000C77D047|nr:sodium-dependent nutrient amino acid transporter 1-like isoform X2 [Eurytemora carolleeae]XP_023345021.1 sodium-dependent nutrient amino acid transporter 1-like isoform X2 [Eurytemora carolleeae]XP_023345030.1 sodium-dependent nutrient amino acid transporter 1-like isoform X2 [Eurytemora carolleeae]XP_023345038.1 sodium-dependent nutrient amino acid transporter 1-like isoform X2 [Eurytemora carolleeae]XP_023345045.1 sodium-dependent nutrient amino acid transporter 1-like isoform X2 [Eurytemo|eukprot:XP_023345013.1 sodium-dependent nutrient amino acid transporter 1-like isoform X2 [Eurytemora affinis]
MVRYGVGIPVLWIALWEVISIMWIYGYNNMAKDIALMVNYQPNWFWKICWAILCPLVLLTIFITSILFWEIPVFNKQVKYPDWAHIIGWILIGISTSQVVIWAVLMMITYCCRRKLLSVVKPSQKWGPGDPKVVESILLEQRVQESAPDYRLGLDIPDYHADGGRRQAGVYENRVNSNYGM